MANRRRKQDETVYDQKYRRFYHNPVNRFTCFYCGLGATCFDHQPPISRVPDYQCLGLKYECYIKVPSCAECNRLAANELTETVIKRAELVKDRIAKKHTKLLGVEWDDGEIKSVLRGQLRKHVKAKEVERQQVQDRIEYYEGVDAFIDAWEGKEREFMGTFQ